jgi:hypothetical protein
MFEELVRNDRDRFYRNRFITFDDQLAVTYYPPACSRFLGLTKDSFKVVAVSL